MSTTGRRAPMTELSTYLNQLPSSPRALRAGRGASPALPLVVQRESEISDSATSTHPGDAGAGVLLLAKSGTPVVALASPAGLWHVDPFEPRWQSPPVPGKRADSRE